MINLLSLVLIALAPLISMAQISNFDSNGNQLIRFDELGDAVDAHDGEIAYFEGVYYLYGTSYDCGYQWGKKDAPFCGFKVYTSKNMKDWHEQGFLFDAGTDVWQSRCNGNTYGCYRPHVVFNERDKLYILWINVYDNRVGYRVFTSREPAGPFTEVAEPTLAVNSTMPVAGLNNGDHDLFVDDNGTAYLAYTDWRAKGAIVIEKLTDDYLTGTGQYVNSVTPGNTEAPCLFKRNNKYYVIYSDPNCGYCSGTGSSYRTANSPLGPWSGPKNISDNSCGGQPSFVSVMKVNKDTLFLYGSDLWNNAAKNEALANYYWAPLRFDEDGNIRPLECKENYSYPKPVQQSQGGEINTGHDGFKVQDDIDGERAYLQSFKVKVSGKIKSVMLTLFKNHYPDADLVIELFRADNKHGTTGQALFTKSVKPAELGWSPKSLEVAMDASIQKGQTYLIKISTSATTGYYGLVRSDLNLYPDGKLFVQSKNTNQMQQLAGPMKFRVLFGR